MMNCMITLRSVTPAQRGQRLLQRAGIPCTLGRTPRKLEEQGCGYGLQVDMEKLPRAVELLREEKVPIRKVYRFDPETGMRELKI